MASSDRSGNTGSHDETLRPGLTNADLDRQEGETRNAAPRPGPSRKPPTPIAHKQSAEQKWEALCRERQAHYDELRHSNNTDELRAWVNESYFDALIYPLVFEDLELIVLDYASEEQKREAQQSESPFVRLDIITALLEECRFDKAELETKLEKYEEKYKDWAFKSEQERKRQLVRDRHQRFYTKRERAKEDEKTMKIIAKAVYTNLVQGLQRAVFTKIERLEADPDVVQLAVDEWIRTTERVLQQREAEVDLLIRKGESIELKTHRQSATIKRLKAEVAELKKEEMEKTREVQLLRQRLEDLQNYIEAKNEEYHNIKFGRGVQAAAEVAGFSEASTPGAIDVGTPEFQSTPMPRKSFGKKLKKVFSKPVRGARILFSTPKGLMTPETPGARRADTSPEYYEEYPEQFEENYEITDTPPVISPPSRRPSALRQTFILTSPKRVEPVFVNIDVEPSSLIDTVNGESFVCDIKLDMQPGGFLPQLPQASAGVPTYESYTSPDSSLEMSESPVIKGRYMRRRNIPPDVTPTSTRKYGLFTPKGIFKRGQLNIRKIPGRHPISELPWSPTYLPADARSPVTQLASPLRWSDRSVSWEKKYETDFGSSASPSPVIKRPIYESHSPDSFLSSSSPVIKEQGYGYSSPGLELSSSLGTSYRYQSPDSDHSSPPAIIQGPGYRYQSPVYDRPSPVIQGSDYRYSSPDSDRSSASPTYVERFGRYPSPVASPLFATPPSGYQPELERSGTPKSAPSPHFPRYQDPLNRRMQLDEMVGSSSYAQQSPETPQSGPSVTFAGYNDPLNRRMQLDEMLNLPSDSMDSERDYLEGSLDSSLLNEARFLNLP